MATSESMCVQKVIEIGIAKVKPKYIMQYMKCLPTGMEFYKKHGSDFRGVYFTEAGTGAEVVFIMEWESFDARSAVTESVLKDPEFGKFLAENAKFIYSKEDYIGFPSHLFPLKPIDGNEKITMELLSVKGFPLNAAKKLSELVQEMTTTADMPEPLAVIHPVVFSHGCLVTLWPVKGNKVNPLLENYGKFIGNPDNWPKMTEVYQELGDFETRLLSPLKPEMIASIDDCKIQ